MYFFCKTLIISKSSQVVRQSHTLPRAGKVKYYGMQGVSGGSGAPIRNESGRMLIPLHEDPSITFGDSTRNYVDKDLRYRTTPSEQHAYRQELDRIVEEKKRLKFNERFGMRTGDGNVRTNEIILGKT